MVAGLVLLMGIGARADSMVPDARTFYLKHLEARGVPELLGRLVDERSAWVGDLPKHWAVLNNGLKVDAGTNALHASGPPEALEALAAVIRVLDVARPEVKLSYKHVRVSRLEDLLGAPAAPPPPNPLSNRSKLVIGAHIAVGDWNSRIVNLLQAGTAELLHEGDVSVIDGCPAAVYLGNPEAERPEFCLLAWPMANVDGSIWLSVVRGTLSRKGRTSAPGEGSLRTEPSGPVCVNCGPAVGEVEFEPAAVITTHLAPNQSVLLGGIWWSTPADESPPGPRSEFTIITAQVVAPIQTKD